MFVTTGFPSDLQLVRIMSPVTSVNDGMIGDLESRTFLTLSVIKYKSD